MPHSVGGRLNSGLLCHLSKGYWIRLWSHIFLLPFLVSIPDPLLNTFIAMATGYPVLPQCWGLSGCFTLSPQGPSEGGTIVTLLHG